MRGTAKLADFADFMDSINRTSASTCDRSHE